jgi:ribosomal protein L10
MIAPKVNGMQPRIELRQTWEGRETHIRMMKKTITSSYMKDLAA